MNKHNENAKASAFMAKLLEPALSDYAGTAIEKEARKDLQTIRRRAQHRARIAYHAAMAASEERSYALSHLGNVKSPAVIAAIAKAERLCAALIAAIDHWVAVGFNYADDQKSFPSLIRRWRSPGRELWSVWQEREPVWIEKAAQPRSCRPSQVQA